MSTLPVRVAILDRGDREARRRSAPEESRFLPLFRALARSRRARRKGRLRRGIRRRGAPAAHERRQRAGLGESAAGRPRPFGSRRNPARSRRRRRVRERPSGRHRKARDERGPLHDARHRMGLRHPPVPQRVRRCARSCPRGSPAAPACSSSSAATAAPASGRSSSTGKAKPLVRVRHAERGAAEERMTMDAFSRRCEPYFEQRRRNARPGIPGRG